MAEKNKKTPVPMTDAEKSQNFVSMGADRVNAIIKAISRLEPLANKRRFAYSSEQIQKIGIALNDAWSKAAKAFAGEKKTGDFHF